MELETVTYRVTPDQKEVIDAAVSLIKETMAEGVKTNGTGSWLNKDPLTYHARKGTIHATELWQAQDLEARERDEPKLRHLGNLVTRYSMAEALRKKAKEKRAPLEEAIEE